MAQDTHCPPDLRAPTSDLDLDLDLDLLNYP